MKSAFRILGIDENASEKEIRRAWKRLARRLHPDVNPSDPRAATRFKAAQRAYRRALTGEPAETPARPAKTPPSRFACRRCCDTYTQAGECPRCELPLHDRARGEATPMADSREVEAMLAALEAPVVAPLFTIEPEVRVPLMAGILAACAMAQAHAGLWPVAIMSVTFALFAIAAETHGRWRDARSVFR